jgi:hypothetical protein
MVLNSRQIDRLVSGVLGVAIFAVYVAMPPATEGAVTEAAMVWVSLIVAGILVLYAVMPATVEDTRDRVMN